MGHMGHGDTGGNGVQGYRHMGNETNRGKVVWGYGYRGMGHMANKAHRECGVQRVWVQGVWGTWAIDHNGYRGYGVEGYGATGGMGHMGNGTHG